MKQRLDQLLVELGIVSSRTRAQGAIRAGHVRVGGRVASRPSDTVDETAEIILDTLAQNFVSRGALKLRHGLNHFGIDPKDCICLDVGASTGGFTQVLLERGAKRVYAIDVGHRQMSPQIADDPCVILLEKLNVKDLTDVHVPEAIDLIVCDVSFISLTKALPVALALARLGAHLVALIKPQFEVGPAHVGRGGIVRDAALHAKTCADISDWLARDMAARVLGVSDSPILGGGGNKEFLIAACLSGGAL